jgi:hypothetical protein
VSEPASESSSTDTPPTESGSTEEASPLSRKEALDRLRGDASKLSNAQFGKIIADEVNRFGGTNVIFQGDFSVEGDFLAGTGRRPTARRATKARIDPKLVAEEVGYYVPPAGFQTGVDALDRNNLAIFAGPARTGRRSRALASLVAVLRADEPEIVELSGNVLGNLAWRVPQSGCGLIVLDSPQGHGKPAAEAIDDTWLSYAGERLRESRSFLAVVTGPVRGSLATAAKRPDFVLEDMELPDPLEIVRRRIAGELPWLSAAEVDTRLDATELAELLDERDDPHFAARAAIAVIEALRTGADLDAAIGRLRDPQEQVREWLGADPDPADIAFVLATAALEGATYLNIADAAVELYRRIGSGSTTMTPRYFRKQLAERSWIKHVNEPGTPVVLRFRDTRLRPAVLAQSWFELDGARTKIVEWLTDLAEHTDVEVRARAAGTAGVLATNDFEHGLHRYLMPWANAPSANLRQSAAQGLNVAGSVGDHADSVWEHVEQWAELVSFDDTERNLPATAALAAGGPLGVANPRRALRVLHTLVSGGDWDFLGPAAMSAHLLLEAGRVREVLDALLEWTEPPESEPMVKALTIFAFAAEGRGSPDTNAGDRPVLMRSAWEHRETLPELWGRALACEPVRELAMDALRAWIGVVDADRSTRDMVLDMLAGIADRGDQDFERLLHALRAWAEHPDDPSDAAADFYNEIVEAETGERSA